MKKFHDYRDYLYWGYRNLRLFGLDPLATLKALPKLADYASDWAKYARLPGAERIAWLDTTVTYEKDTHPFDAHYLYQGTWAAEKIHKSKAKAHVDVGSDLNWVCSLAPFTKTTFIDIRPSPIAVTNLTCKQGSILAMPYPDSSVKSLSCLHVAEHVGLGRYGDPIDPLGTKKACAELARILARGGNLYFSLPIGRPRVCFNAHRIHSPRQVVEYFDGLNLVEFSGITDDKRFLRRIPLSRLENEDYGCGFFHFTKR